MYVDVDMAAAAMRGGNGGTVGEWGGRGINNNHKQHKASTPSSSLPFLSSHLYTSALLKRISRLRREVSEVSPFA
jgi:hypothetical protein